MVGICCRPDLHKSVGFGSELQGILTVTIDSDVIGKFATLDSPLAGSEDEVVTFGIFDEFASHWKD